LGSDRRHRGRRNRKYVPSATTSRRPMAAPATLRPMISPWFPADPPPPVAGTAAAAESVVTGGDTSRLAPTAVAADMLTPAADVSWENSGPVPNVAEALSRSSAAVSAVAAAKAPPISELCWLPPASVLLSTVTAISKAASSCALDCRMRPGWLDSGAAESAAAAARSSCILLRDLLKSSGPAAGASSLREAAT